MIEKIKTFISKTYGWAIIILVITSILFLIISPTISKLEKITNQSSSLLLKNLQLLSSIDSLSKEVQDLKKEQTILNEQLSNKETVIIEKEKIIYKDGQLIVPEDYNELKSNYETLSSLYNEKSDMYIIVKDQLEKNYNIIEQQDSLINELKIQNANLLSALNKKQVFGQYIKAGIDYDFNNINYKAGYQIVLFEKVSLEVLIQLPTPSASILIGYKL